jgi:hypothetical protein
MFENRVLTHALSKWRTTDYHVCRENIHATMIET